MTTHKRVNFLPLMLEATYLCILAQILLVFFKRRVAICIQVRLIDLVTLIDSALVLQVPFLYMLIFGRNHL